MKEAEFKQGFMDHASFSKLAMSTTAMTLRRDGASRLSLPEYLPGECDEYRGGTSIMV